MVKQNEFVNYLTENMQTLGNVTARRMFGGYGIFLNGLMFGLVAEDVLYFKADTQNNNFFEDRSLPHFTYMKNGKAMRMSYRQSPESALDDPDELHDWASRSYAAAVRANK